MQIVLDDKEKGLTQGTNVSPYAPSQGGTEPQRCISNSTPKRRNVEKACVETKWCAYPILKQKGL